MIYAANSDIGMKRQLNEDSFYVKTYSQKTALAVVCDGMGGAKGGCEASQTAVEAFSEKIESFLEPYIGNKEKSFHASDVIKALKEATQEANDAVRAYAKRNPSLKGMGTTLVATLIIDKIVFCVNVGDSRIYFAKGGKIKQVTKDHSYVQYLLDIGKLSAEEAKTFPSKNIITRAIGVEENVEPDILKETVSEGTFILLCSDGLTNFVSDSVIRDTLTEGVPKNIDQVNLGICVRKLIDIANRNGGADNITAVVVKM